jgi:putative two-component system response regulator
MITANENINLNSKNANILVVDDEMANIRLLEKMLTSMGYKNVVCTQDPKQVLPLYQQHNSDLILLVLNMPELDGYRVMAQLKELGDNFLPPILVLTAQHMQSFCQRAFDSGAHDYVTKPFDADELLSRVRNMLEIKMSKKFMHHQNEILEQKVQKRTQDIHDTRLQSVRRLGRAAEYRDNETGLHIIRMSKISAVITKASGMCTKDCELILNAAPMHDIGKIGIPDCILLKPGKLDATEWDIMQSNAQFGAGILSGDNSDLMTMAHDISISHHEKWNGNGYPNNLMGDAIPITGRITALSDVFDALTSERPYKNAWSVQEAENLIAEESGRHFDPRLASLFLDNLSEIVAIKEKYADPG